MNKPARRLDEILQITLGLPFARPDPFPYFSIIDKLYTCWPAFCAPQQTSFSGIDLHQLNLNQSRMKGFLGHWPAEQPWPRSSVSIRCQCRGIVHALDADQTQIRHSLRSSESVSTMIFFPTPMMIYPRNVWPLTFWGTHGDDRENDR